MKPHSSRRRGLDLSAEQRQSLSSFCRREQLSPHLKPQDIGRLVEPEVGDKQTGFDPNQGLGQGTVGFLEHPFQSDRGVNDERHGQSFSRCPVSTVVRSVRDF